jgi:hypothetical protein
MSTFTLTKSNNRLKASPSGGGGGSGVHSNRSSGSPVTSINGTTRSTQSISSKGGGSSSIDVVASYDWNASPSNNIIKPPSIQLKEFYVDKSSFLAQLGYGLDAFSDAGFQQAEKIASNFSADKGKTILDELKGQAKGVIDSVKSVVSLPKLDSAGVSGAYGGLYVLKPTGFKYNLPFYEDVMRTKSASWQDQYAGGAGNSEIIKLIEFGNNMVRANIGSLPGLGVFSDPGLYIERTKHYQPSPGAEALSFTFPLLNTLSQESIQKNYELIWLLSFQNSPYRKDMSRIDPPCMYEVLVPGIRYIKYAVVTSLKVDFLGTRRKISLSVPRGPGPPSSRADVIVPEAYKVTINMTSLTDESANFMIEALHRGNSL